MLAHEIDPFPITPDPSAYVARAATEEALTELVSGIRHGQSPLVLTGPVGIGKTMLLRVLGHVLRREMTPLYLPYPHLEPHELWQWALSALGVAVDAKADVEAAFLRETRILAGKNAPVLLLIDDAGALPIATVRVLESRSDQLSIVASATVDGAGEVAQSLSGALRREAGSSFGPRAVFVRFTEPMDRDETEVYLTARLERAGVSPALIARFDTALIDRLHGQSGGLPVILHDLAESVLRELRAEPKLEVVRDLAPPVQARTASALAAQRPGPAASLASGLTQSRLGEPPLVTGFEPRPSAETRVATGLTEARAMVAEAPEVEEPPRSAVRRFAAVGIAAAALVLIGIGIGATLGRLALFETAPALPHVSSPPREAAPRTPLDATSAQRARTAARASADDTAGVSGTSEQAASHPAVDASAPAPAPAASAPSAANTPSAASATDSAPAAARVADARPSPVSQVPAAAPTERIAPVAQAAPRTADKSASDRALQASAKPVERAATAVREPVARRSPAPAARREVSAIAPRTRAVAPVLAGMKPPADIAIASDEPLLPVSILVADGVRVEVDGELRGRGPLRGLLLSPGSHMVMARHADGRVEARSIKVSLSSPLELDLRD